MKNTTMFPREEHADVLFQKILNDPWACEKLQETFCNSLALNDDTDNSPSASTFANVLFDAYHNRDLSAFLMVICQNTLFDLLRNSYLIPYRFNADGKQNPIQKEICYPNIKKQFMRKNIIIFRTYAKKSVQHKICS